MVAALLFLGATVGWFVADRSNNAGPSAVDEGFAQDMIIHHSQALSIAVPAMERATEPATRSFAKEVVILQMREIGIFQTWLEDWRRAEDGDRQTAMDWMGTPTPVSDMPGLASEAELEALDQATGRAVDRQFFDLMSAHHQGGIHMAEYAAERGNEKRVTELASQIARNQRIEMREYQAALGRMGL